MTAISSATPPPVLHYSPPGSEKAEGPGPDRDHDGDEGPAASAQSASAAPPPGTGGLVDAIA